MTLAVACCEDVDKNEIWDMSEGNPSAYSRTETIQYNCITIEFQYKSTYSSTTSSSQWCSNSGGCAVFGVKFQINAMVC